MSDVATRQEQVLEFLRAFTARVPKDLHLELWQDSDRRSHYYRPDQLEEAAARVAACTGQIYISVSAAAETRPANRRISQDDADYAVGVVVDGDVKAGAFASKDDAREFFRSLPVKPSWVVDSGGGLQAFWRFAKPSRLTETSRAEAVELAELWGAYVRAEAAERGVVLDTTHDLARLMRVPGGINTKYGEPRPVVIDSMAGYQFMPELLRKTVPAATVKAAKAAGSGSDFHELDGQVVPIGQQEKTLNSRACSMRSSGMTAAATVAGLWADVQTWPLGDPAWPWLLADVEAKVRDVWRDIEPNGEIRSGGAGSLSRNGTAPSKSPSGPTEPMTVGLVRASAVKPVRVSWAWDQRIPVGMASLIVGQGGFGKSLEVCWLAAGWSRGTIPGDFEGTPVDVAIASAEDHRQAVLVPRLLAAGADLSRVHFIEQIDADGDADDIAINGDVADIERALVAGGVRVLLIDTVVAHIPAQHDSYNEQRVRAVLKPLKRMAERNDQVVFGVMHLNRREARDVLTRINGSGGFGNLARSVLLFAADPDAPDGPTRILALAKSNVGGRAETLKVRLEACLVAGDDGVKIPTVRLVDSGTSTYTSNQLLAVPADDEERNAGAEAERFLEELLADGPVEAQTVKRAARDDGIAEKTLWRAAKKLGVKTNDRGGFGPGFPSRWSLLSHAPPYSAITHDGPVGQGWPSRESDATPELAPAEPLDDTPRSSSAPAAVPPGLPLPDGWVEADDARRRATLAAIPERPVRRRR